MTTQNNTTLVTEILEGTLLTLDHVTTRLTVLALNTSRKPEQPCRVRMLLGDLLLDIQDCEEQSGTYSPSLQEGLATYLVLRGGAVKLCSAYNKITTK